MSEGHTSNRTDIPCNQCLLCHKNETLYYNNYLNPLHVFTNHQKCSTLKLMFLSEDASYTKLVSTNLV